MGVPAFFRWLSKKYPKIVLPVVEEDESKIPDGDGNEVVVPIDISKPNPNLMEFDNLYLDMNGIVHPCTHPEGKPAPETEEDMMVEIFTYTERIVRMIRPRKLLFLAIDGVAPRAKMNQQRSRRFRSSQEAKEKEEARKEAVAMFEAMGHAVSEDTKNKKGWDSNAITPGTPFMDLLAASLRYWVVRKINTEPGWKDIQVILSDASVPGEGEHKIMDFIRRQRTNPDHNPNTRHVICGLDADLIMLSLATHEPHFRVLREDVFHQEGSRTACRICGQEGHYAAQCTGEKKIPQDENNVKVAEKKPWIFLDVAILREYLEVELNVQRAPFPFDLERAIDDWVLLIFFVGNDFLPHLPSLEIREGAIDTLLKIWKDEMPRMGGYLTDHGKVDLARAEIILQGIAKREDDIFRRRREAEERQDQNAKRRKLETSSGGSREDSNMRIAETAYVPVETNAGPLIHPSLPPRPAFEVTAVMNPPQFNHPPTSSTSTAQSFTAHDGIKLVSNHDVVANRRAIRLANMNAAEMLKAELAGRASTQPSPQAADESVVVPHVPPTASDIPVEPLPNPLSSLAPSSTIDDYAHLDVLPGLSGSQSAQVPEGVVMLSAVPSPAERTPSLDPQVDPQSKGDGPPEPEMSPVDARTTENIALMDVDSPSNDVNDASTKDNGDLRGIKRKLDDTADGEESFAVDDDEAPDGADVPPAFVRKVNPDGSVEQEDTVRLWEPGYKERYYRQKFGVELSDLKFRKELTKSYVEGLAWVLHYYYQGTPSWQWYYPYHYAPFAADFEDVATMEIKFDHGQPFKPFEQLMGVFPAASGGLIPEAFRSLMIEEDSPIIDFYPSTFDIDMNGKKMAWQGVALLPFIDEKRLLEAMAPRYEQLTEEEVRRNNWGTNLLFVGQGHGLHTFLSGLYVKRKSNDPVPLNTKLSNGIAGSVLPDPQCIPDSTYFSPFEKVSLPDMPDNHSLSSYYYYPRQLRPHRSQMLPGVRRPFRVLTSADHETVHRRSGYGRGRDNGAQGHPRGLSYSMPMHGGSGYERDRGGYGYGPPHGGLVYNNGPSGRGSYGSNGYYGQSYNTVGYGHYYGAGRDEGHFNTVGYGHYYGLGRDNEGNVTNGGYYGSRGRGVR